MLTILDRYLFRELLMSFAAVLSVLALIIIGQLFVRLLGDAADGQIPESVILPLLGLGMIKTLVQLIPLALLVGMMLTIGRLYRDSEMAAIQCAGIGFGQLYRPIMLLAVPVVVLLGVLSLYVSPLSIRLADKLAFESEHRADISGITEGRFIKAKGGNVVVFAEQMGRRNASLESVFIHSRKQGVVSIETAINARQYEDQETGEQMLELGDGHRYEGKPGGGEWQILSFKRHTMRIPPLALGKKIGDKDSIPTAELWGSEKPVLQAELQWRLSIPIAAALLVLLAVPFSYTTPRQGRFAKLGYALILYIVYSNVVIMAVSLTESGSLPVWVGVWWVHLLVGGLVLALFVQRYGWRWSLQRLMLRKIKA